MAADGAHDTPLKTLEYSHFGEFQHVAERRSGKTGVVTE